MFSAQGHPSGLNAALARMLYFPPALPPADPIFQLTVERVVQRDIATPEELYLFFGFYLMPSWVVRGLVEVGGEFYVEKLFIT